jgi:hypothetical protein
MSEIFAMNTLQQQQHIKCPFLQSYFCQLTVQEDDTRTGGLLVCLPTINSSPVVLPGLTWPRETVTHRDLISREVRLPRTFSSEARLLIDSITDKDDYKIRLSLLGTEEDEEIERAPFFKSIYWNSSLAKN